MIVLDYKIVKVVSQIVRTTCSSMSIEHSKKTNMWPDSSPKLRTRFENIKNYTDPIFVVVSHYTLICVCGVRFDNATLFGARTSNLMIFKFKSERIELKRIFTK